MPNGRAEIWMQNAVRDDCAHERFIGVCKKPRVELAPRAEVTPSLWIDLRPAGGIHMPNMLHLQYRRGSVTGSIKTNSLSNHCCILTPSWWLSRKIRRKGILGNLTSSSVAVAGHAPYWASHFRGHASISIFLSFFPFYFLSILSPHSHPLLLLLVAAVAVASRKGFLPLRPQQCGHQSTAEPNLIVSWIHLRLECIFRSLGRAMQRRGSRAHAAWNLQRGFAAELVWYRGYILWWGPLLLLPV